MCLQQVGDDKFKQRWAKVFREKRTFFILERYALYDGTVFKLQYTKEC